MRHDGLKIKASTAVKNKMIFTINTNNGDVIRKALIDRGWIEKISPNISETTKRNSKIQYDENLERQILSNLVHAYPSNLIWDSKKTYSENIEKENSINYRYSKVNTARGDQNRKQSHPIKNHFKVEALWTTKQGLCQCTKKSITELNIPRIYMCHKGHDNNDFLLDYKTTACTSLLQWVLSKLANGAPIFSDTGNISTNVYIFAINRCKEYLFMKQNNNAHTQLYHKTTTGQWNSFINKYFTLIAGKDVFHNEKNNKLTLLIGYAKILLKKIHENRPLLSSEGYHNIWIIKPLIGCAGKGVRMASDFTVITDWMQRNSYTNYVVQKYIGTLL